MPPFPGPAAAERPHFAESLSIGRRSRALKNRHLLGRVWPVLLGVMTVILAAAALSLMIGGIGFVGLLVTALVCVLVAALLLRYPRLRTPTRDELEHASLREIVGKTELWLEARRGSLPHEAALLLDQVGVQLDSLALHLDKVPEREPIAAEIREMVGQHLPTIIAAYDASLEPASEPLLVDRLIRVAAEIDYVARQLASGTLDDLALKARYFDYRSEGAGTPQMSSR